MDFTQLTGFSPVDETKTIEPIETELSVQELVDHLRFAFSAENNDIYLSYDEFEYGIKEIFPAVPSNKIKHIFSNEAINNRLDYHKFLKSNNINIVIQNLMKSNEKASGKKYRRLSSELINVNVMAKNVKSFKRHSAMFQEQIEDYKLEVDKLRKWKKSVGEPALELSQTLQYKYTSIEQERSILNDEHNKLKIDYEIKMNDLQTISNELLLLEDRYNALLKDYQDTQFNAESYKNELENLNKIYKNEIAKSISQDNLIKQFKDQNNLLESQTIKYENEINNKNDEITELTDKIKAMEDVIEQQLFRQDSDNKTNNDSNFDDDNSSSPRKHKKKNSIILTIDGKGKHDNRKYSLVQVGGASSVHNRHRTMSVGTVKQGNMDDEIGGANYDDYNNNLSDADTDYEAQIRREIEKEMKKDWKDKITAQITKEIEQKYRIKLKQNRLKIDMDFNNLNKKCQGLYTALQKQTIINKKLKNELIKVVNQQKDRYNNNIDDDDEKARHSDTDDDTDDTDTDSNDTDSGDTDSNDDSDDSDDDTNRTDDTDTDSDDDSNSDDDSDDSEYETPDMDERIMREHIRNNKTGCLPCIGMNNSRKKRYRRIPDKRKRHRKYKD